MTAAEKLTMIQTALAAGRPVYLGTATRTVKVTPKVAASYDATGTPFFKLNAAGTSLLAREGKRYVCADYCEIVA